MKKTFKIIILNLLIIIVGIIVLDYISAWSEYKLYVRTEAKKRNYKLGKLKNFAIFDYKIGCCHISKYIKKINFDKRTYIPQNNNGHSIIFFGCSYAFSASYTAKELGHYTKLAVYNRGLSSKGLAEFFYQTTTKELYNDIKIPPKYIVYIFIPDQISRIYRSKYGVDGTYISYDIINNRLKENSSKYFFHHLRNKLHILRQIDKRTIYYDLIKDKNNEYNFNYMKLFFVESKKELLKHYPNTKFFIIKYPQHTLDMENRSGYKYIYNTQRWEELEKEGFVVVDLKKELNFDITQSKYCIPDGHPNKLAFYKIYRLLIKNYNL